MQVRFIGNQAVAIRDSTLTLVSDFPYESGAFGYHTYRRDDVTLAGAVLLLITHSHRDHFDATAPRDAGWRVLGPADVTRRFAAGAAVVRDSVVRHGPLVVRPIRTPHAGLEHYSYRVEWRGRAFYFVGDTDDPAALLAQRNLDMAFVTPWLWQAVRERGARIDARRVVIYHHTARDRVAGCAANCLVPAQGDSIPLP